jgi:hypothetical protein
VAYATEAGFLSPEGAEDILNRVPSPPSPDASNGIETLHEGQNGYAIFNNGFIIQWGVSPIFPNSNQGNQTAPLTINFPNKAWGCVLSAYNQSSNNTSDARVQLVNITKSNITFYFQGDQDGTGPLGISFVAFGK